MTIDEYFGDWSNVIDKSELYKIIRWLKTVDQSLLCPTINNIFKAFRVCPYSRCKVIFLGQDPYPQKGVATGILFGNSVNTTNISPSLRVIKEAAINYEVPHNRIIFDNTLESWASQGILMINTALTCEVNKVGSHFTIWKPFISSLIRNLCEVNCGLIFVLFGNQAKLFKEDIIGPQHIIEEYHPAYYARRGEKMSPTLFISINNLLKSLYNESINFYIETDYGTC